MMFTKKLIGSQLGLSHKTKTI